MHEIRFYHRDRAEFGWLSNFHPAPFPAGGVIWPTVEHFFQAMKCVDETTREDIRALPTPRQAKLVGRHVPLRDDWLRVRVEVMGFALRRKFLYHRDLADALLATGDARLVEDNARDSFWGVGRNFDGQNALGVLLMRERGLLRADRV